MDLDLLIDGLEQEMDDRKLKEPLRYVVLNEPCRRFAEAFCDPDKTIIVFPAPNSIGKTWTTVTCLGWTLWPNTAPFWFQEKILRKISIMDRSFRFCSTTEEAGIQGTIQRAIKSLWPQGRYNADKNRKAFDSAYTTDTNWIGDIMTYDQEAKQFEGATRGLIIYNEPPPESVRKACVFRTRMGGFEVFPMTPLQGSAWIKDKIVDRASVDSNIAVVTGTIEDACKDHGVNGHLTHKRIQELIKEMDPDEIEARAHGKFMHLSGLIFKTFSREQFMSRIPLKADRLGFPFQVIDPGGYNKPYAVIWGQIVNNPKNGIQILREWPNGGLGTQGYFENVKEPNMTDKDYCCMFEDVERELGFEKDKVHRILDKRFGHVQDTTEGKSLRDRFADRGYYFNDSYKVPDQATEVKTGIQAIKNYLKVCPASKLPYFCLDPSCINIARSFERWSLDPVSQKPNDDVWKNFIDCVRYAAAADLVCELHESWDELRQPSWGN